MELGAPAVEPGSNPAYSSVGPWFEVPRQRDPDEVALKPRMVKRITANLRGRKEQWIPPAGLYLENSKKAHNQNLWEVTAPEARGKLGPAPEQPRGEWIALPQERDPEVVALKPKHVRQVTKNLRGPAATWKPPAGLYLENSKAGLNYNMWDPVSWANRVPPPKPEAESKADADVSA